MDDDRGRDDGGRIEKALDQLPGLDASERSALLDETSDGGPEFHSQVEQLLDGYDAGREFVERLTDPPIGASGAEHRTQMFSAGEVVAARFRIIRLLGTGGLGEVYEAEDLVLKGEPVALKTLRASLAADETAVDRLTQELLLARRISHPNVCRVYDVYRHPIASGAPISFFTMERLDGETLAARVRRGRIATPDALPLVRQMAEAIDAAHAANVAHGDLKPGNIMLVPSTRGVDRVVVTDFGLARWVPAGTTLLSTTLESRRWGTPVYMAPEQLLGQPLTRASDIYALGVVCYEMVTGEQPFNIVPPLLLAVRKLRHAPRPPRELVPDLDPRWEAAILRCLDVDPGRRFQLARDLVDELERGPTRRRARAIGAAALATAGVAAATWIGTAVVDRRTTASPVVARQAEVERTVAVLPFTQEGSTPEGDAFALGLTVALTDQLGSASRGRPGLYVIPAAEIVDTGVNTPAIAQQTLGATLFVSGRLAVAGDRTQIAIGLNELTDQGFRLKDSRTVSLPSNDRRVLDTVAVAAMQLLDLNEPDRAVPRTGASRAQLDAEKSYLAGRGHLVQGSRHLRAAIEAFQHAIRQDSQYAAAYAGLSEAFLADHRASSDAGSLGQAQTLIDRAIAIEPRQARSHVIRGRVYLRNSQAQRAILELTTALALDPDVPDARNALAAAYDADGAIEKAEQEFRAAVARHPKYWSTYEDLGTFLYGKGRYHEAEGYLVTASSYAPANRRAILNLATVYLVQERFAAAESELKKGTALSPDAWLSNNLAWVYILEGKLPDAVRTLEEAVKQPRADSSVWSSLARAYRWAGGRQDEERAAYQTALQRADEEVRVNPLDADVRSNRAYLLAELRRAPEALREIDTVLALDSAKANVGVRFNSVLIHERTGNRKRALEDLGLALRGGYSRSVVARHPDLKRLRDDPGYQRVLDVAEQRTNQRFKAGRSQ
jgi:Flp pilus assembly protein TadD/TolB-like protein